MALVPPWRASRGMAIVPMLALLLVAADFVGAAAELRPLKTTHAFMRPVELIEGKIESLGHNRRALQDACDPSSATPNQCYNANGQDFICCPGQCPSTPGETPSCSAVAGAPANCAADMSNPNACFNAEGSTFICCPASCPSVPTSQPTCGDGTSSPTSVPTPSPSPPESAAPSVPACDYNQGLTTCYSADGTQAYCCSQTCENRVLPNDPLCTKAGTPASSPAPTSTMTTPPAPTSTLATPVPSPSNSSTFDPDSNVTPADFGELVLGLPSEADLTPILGILLGNLHAFYPEQAFLDLPDVLQGKPNGVRVDFFSSTPAEDTPTLDSALVNLGEGQFENIQIIFNQGNSLYKIIDPSGNVLELFSGVGGLLSGQFTYTDSNGTVRSAIKPFGQGGRRLRKLHQSARSVNPVVRRQLLQGSDATTVTLSILQCGAGVTGASAVLTVAGSGFADTIPAVPFGKYSSPMSEISPGTFTATVPASTPLSKALTKAQIGESTTKACTALGTAAAAACANFNAANKVGASKAFCLGIGLALLASEVLSPAAVAAARACQVAVTGLEVACKLPAPATGLIVGVACKKAADLLLEPVVNSGHTVLIVETIPGKGTKPFLYGFVGKGSTTSKVDDITGEQDKQFSNLNIGGSISNPAAFQGYTFFATLKCGKVGDKILLSISGTDGYMSSSTCSISQDSTGVPVTCSLNVPGAEGGVQDTLTAILQNDATIKNQLVVVFQ